MSKQAYEELIKEDIEHLKKTMPNSLVRAHIIDVLADSVRQYYPNEKAYLKLK